MPQRPPEGIAYRRGSRPYDNEDDFWVEASPTPSPALASKPLHEKVDPLELNTQYNLGTGADSGAYEILRRHLKQQCFTYGGFNTFGVDRVFATLDTDRGGTIDIDEFRRAVRNIGKLAEQRMSDQQVDALFHGINTKGLYHDQALTLTPTLRAVAKP